MKTIYIVRHGETEYNVLHLVQGWCNSPLTDKGIAQAHAVGQHLRNISFAAAFTGDLVRQQETAERILKENRFKSVTELYIDRRFRETHFGSFEGTKESSLAAAIGKHLHIEATDFRDIIRYLNFDLERVNDLVSKVDSSGMAESAEVCTKRLQEGLVAAAAMVPDDSKILVVTSGSVMSMLMHNLSGGHICRLVNNGEILILNADQDRLEIKEFITEIGSFPALHT